MAALGPGGDAVAQTSRRPLPDDGRPVAEAVRRSSPIDLDGQLEERAWAAAPAVESFTQNDPEEGRPVSQPTRVHLMFDETALYVGAWLGDSGRVASRLGRRDAWMQDSDWFSISLDSYHDHLTAYRFMVNPAGVRSDEILSGGNSRFGDDSWDPVWEVATAVSDSGWTVEMRIPFSQLRFGDEPEQVWGLQLERTIARRQEEAVFAFTPKRERGGIARFGHLIGIEEIHRGRGLELLPYAVGRAEYVPIQQADVGFGNPYRDGSDYYGDLGLDLKYHLASNLTLDATVNPDFGQVEVDPAVVNLTAYETRFDEKRPFFVEGSDIFEFGAGGGFRGTQLLYSRRIGGAPRWQAPDQAVYQDVPDAATIIAAGKLTGRTARGWTIGVLEAVTAEETARFIDASGTEGESVVAPLSNYFAGRVERSLREGQTVVGGLVTAVHRRLGGLELADRLRSEAYTGGIDFSHEWADRAWAVTGHIATSRIAGQPGAIVRAQTSSARYYQRPDAGHLEFDSLATSLSGYDVNLELSREAGLHWLGDVELSATSPGFEVNDMGFQRSADRLRAEASLRYVENRPGPVFRDWNVSLRPEATWNHGGDFLGAELNLDVRGELLSYWNGELGFSHDFPGYDDRLTRGGPLTRDVASNRVSLELETDERKAWTLRTDAWYRWDEAGGDQYELGFDIGLRPSEAWNISLGPELNRERSVAQYVGSLEDPLVTSTFGRRYLFAGLDQTTVALETRLNVTFRPGLTLELYAQPFIASAAFDGLKELRAPRTFSFRTYGEDVGTITEEDGEFIVDPDGAGPAQAFRVEDEDFNRRSLRGNAVLRWEWRPGSTLYLVWQQQRSDVARLDNLSLDRDIGAMFSADAQNVFLLKLSYWISP